MKNRWFGRALALCLALLMVSPALAEDIAVMAFEGAPEDAVTTLREAIRSEILRTEGFGVAEAGGDETLFDVLIVNACEDDTDPACLDLVSEYLGVDAYIFGNVDEANGTATVKWYKKGEGFLREVSKPYKGKGDVAKKIASRLIGGDTGVLSVTSNTAGAIVWVDDKKAGLIPFEEELPVGPHSVKVEKEGYLAVEPQQITITVDETSAVNVDLELDPNFAGGPGDEGMGLLTQVGIVTASVGGALLIGGAVTGVLEIGKQSEFDDLLKKGTVTPEDIEAAKDLQTDGENLALTTTILMAAGGALAATGVALIIVDLVGVEDDSDAEASNYDFNVFVAPDGAGASFQLRW